ncbi:NHL repeat-containing protein [Hymenobacter tenuis]
MQELNYNVSSQLILFLFMKSFYSHSLIILSLGLALSSSITACKKDLENPQSDKPLVFTTVSTLAGNGLYGLINGPGETARFVDPEDAAVDSQGNVYVADTGNNCIRKITPAGEVTTLAGSNAIGLANGVAASALFFGPIDVALDSGDNLFVADYANHCIRKITPAGIVSTFAGTGTPGYTDGKSTTAQFNGPLGLAIDMQGNVYVADSGNQRLRKISPSGVVSTLAGNGSTGYKDGPSNTAEFKRIEGLAVNKQGILYVTDYTMIRKITADGTVSTLAGDSRSGHVDGPGNTAQFSMPNGIALDAQGDLYVAEFNDHCIRRITPIGEVSTLAGSRVRGYSDGPVGTSKFNSPSGLTIDNKGALYITEFGGRIRKITAE